MDNPIVYAVALVAPILILYIIFGPFKKKGAAQPEKMLHIESGMTAIQGRRPTMEDDHIAIDDLAEEEEFAEKIKQFSSPRAFYGIYDGHRGSRAAEFAAEHLHGKILEEPSFSSGAVEEAIHKGFVDTDKELLEKAIKEGEWNDGCTAAVAIVLGETVYTANVGDAEVLLGRIKEGTEDEIEGIVLTKIHKPNDPQERARIEKEGGMVLGNRVGGALAVARAFGDLEFKTPAEDGDVVIGKLISEEPFINSIKLIPGRDKFLIVGCDGVWEALDRQGSVQFVHQNLAEGPQAASELLANHAFNKGSQDNISAIVISLTWE